MALLQAIAIFAAALFAGAALYINLVEHPARLSCGDEVAAREFGPSYARAAVMQVALALLATAGGVCAALAGGGALWWLGAGLMVAVIPYTLAVMMPVNRLLLGSGPRTQDAGHLLRRWGRLHGVRTGLALAATAVYLGAALA